MLGMQLVVGGHHQGVEVGRRELPHDDQASKGAVMPSFQELWEEPANIQLHESGACTSGETHAFSVCSASLLWLAGTVPDC